MANKNSPHDDNYVAAALFAQQGATSFVAPGQIDQITGRILVDLAGGGGVAGAMQKDQYVATNNQTSFVATKTVAFDFYMSVNGSVQTPTTDYSITAGNYVLVSGIPAGSIVILLYATS